MSHELRTPLNSLLILAEQLEANPDNNMTESQVEYASVIRSSGNDLLTLLNDILDLAKVESGTFTVNPVNTPIGPLAGALVREFEPVARAKGLGFAMDVAPGCPEEIVTDPDRLRQVIKNLLTNAFKFTPQGAISIKVGLAARGWNRSIATLAEAAAVVAFWVTDTGIGIEESAQSRIFEEFAQGDGATSRLYGGTGLGLSISRELVARLGGEITVASKIGQGSTFTVYLPADAPSTPSDQPALPSRRIEPAAKADAAAPTNSPGQDRRPDQVDFDVNTFLRGITVLVIDDDMRNIFALTALLERSKATVLHAESGFKAIEMLELHNDFDIVLTDIMMPIMDGYETIRAIRRSDLIPYIPIIAVTSKFADGERQRCLDAGADGYVPKPLSSAQLYSALLQWLPVADKPA